MGGNEKGMRKRGWMGKAGGGVGESLGDGDEGERPLEEGDWR